MKINYSVVTKPSFLLVHPDLPSLIARRAHLFSNPILRIPYTRERFVGLATRSRYSTTERRPSRSPSSSSPPFSGRPGLFEKKSDKAENRARVYEFLRGFGIVPDELDGLELPVTVEVMKERVEFLRTLGLNIEDINNYPLVLGCSVKKNMIPVLDYLGKLGVRKSTFTEFLRRYPQVLHSSVVVDLAPVVKYLQGMDVKPIDVPRVLEAYPEVLGFKLEGTMSTSVAYLVGIGVSRREIGAVLTRFPEILGMRVGRTIKPLVEYLETLGIPRLAVARLIETRPQILGFGLEDRVKPNVEAIIEFWVREGSVGSVVARYPEILGLGLRPRLESQRALLESLVGLSSVGFGRVVEKMPQVVSLAETATMKHVEFFGSCGFSPELLRRMIESCPQILALNLDIARMSFGYYKAEMGRDLDELAEFPAFFTYGLESVVKPRQRVVARKGVKCSLAWMLNCSDDKFKRRIEYDAIDAGEMGSDKDEPFDMKTLTEPRSDDSESEYDGEDDDDEEEDGYV